jgi:transposase
MVKLAASLKAYQKTIKNTLDSGVNNGRVEATNTHIQTVIKQDVHARGRAPVGG